MVGVRTPGYLVRMDWRDPETRETLAQEAYYAERMADVARDREHELDEAAQYFALDWRDVSEGGKRPYRTAVAVACEAFEKQGVS